MPQYVVLKPCWVPDGTRRSQLRKVGETLTLTESQAEYLLGSEQIQLASSPAPTFAPYKSTDVIVVRRDGSDRVLQPSEVSAYLAPLTSGGTTPTPADTTAPTITVSPSQSVVENSAFTLTLTANEPVSWSKVGGADAAQFTLVNDQLTLPAKDFETPSSAAGTNAYVVQLQAKDQANNVSNITITVNVTDAAEGGPANLTTNLDDESNSSLVPGLTV